VCWRWVIAILAGRFVVRPLFQSLAATDNRETFTVVALFIVLAASAATARADLSLTLGAFLAGMAVSDTPYRHVVQNEIKPFAGLLLGLFFMSVGMGVNLPAMAAIWPAVLATALVILIVKTAVVFIAARLNGWAVPGATQTGLPAEPGIRVCAGHRGHCVHRAVHAGQLGRRRHGGGGGDAGGRADLDGAGSSPRPSCWPSGPRRAQPDANEVAEETSRADLRHDGGRLPCRRCAARARHSLSRHRLGSREFRRCCLQRIRCGVWRRA
jgi:hypothetical protein